MTPQERVLLNVQPKGIYNVRFIEEKAGIRKYKLYEFLKGRAEITKEEALSVLSFIKNATRFQK